MATPRPADISRVPAPSKQRLRLWIRLLRTARFVENALRERLRADFGSTLPRFDVMAALHRVEDGMTMTELSRYLMVSNGNVTGIVDYLVKQDLVSRRSDKNDRRATFVRLTAKGRARFDEMAAAHEAWIDELLAEVPAREAGEVIALLDRLNLLAVEK